MSLISVPKFVSLDTASISYMAANRGESAVKDMMDLFRAAVWIPFITYHHLEEMACHGNADTFRNRFDFLAILPHVAYLRQPEEKANVGSILDLRAYEMEFLAGHPGKTHEQIIEAVRPKVRVGFYSGRKLVDENCDYFELLHAEADEIRRHKGEIANLTHFPMGDPTERISATEELSEVTTEEEVRKRFAKMAIRLERKIRESGDCRDIDPAAAAKRLMEESFNDLSPSMGSGASFMDRMMTQYEVSPNRLPKNPTMEDVGYEGIFVAQTGIIACNLLRNKGELINSVRKEALPSWVVWQEIDRRIKRLPKAEAGNLNDKHLAAFGLYVDVLNVDKRIAELLRQAGRTNKLLRLVYERIPKKSGFGGLLDRLKSPESSS